MGVGDLYHLGQISRKGSRACMWKRITTLEAVSVVILVWSHIPLFAARARFEPDHCFGSFLSECQPQGPLADFTTDGTVGALDSNQVNGRLGPSKKADQSVSLFEEQSVVLAVGTV